MPFPVMIPNQDGAGVVDAVGAGVDPARVGERVWVYETHMNRPFGTAAQWCTVPAHKAVPLPPGADFVAGACMGIPAMTAHRCVFADGSVRGKTVLVQGGAGAVGSTRFRWHGSTARACSRPSAAEAEAERARSTRARTR